MVGQGKNSQTSENIALAAQVLSKCFLIKSVSQIDGPGRANLSNAFSFSKIPIALPSTGTTL